MFLDCAAWWFRCILNTLITNLHIHIPCGCWAHRRKIGVPVFFILKCFCGLVGKKSEGFFFFFFISINIWQVHLQMCKTVVPRESAAIGSFTPSFLANNVCFLHHCSYIKTFVDVPCRVKMCNCDNSPVSRFQSAQTYFPGTSFTLSIRGCPVKVLPYFELSVCPQGHAQHATVEVALSTTRCPMHCTRVGTRDQTFGFARLPSLHGCLQTRGTLRSKGAHGRRCSCAP